jgi:hypothetical protein
MKVNTGDKIYTAKISLGGPEDGYILKIVPQEHTVGEVEKTHFHLAEGGIIYPKNDLYFVTIEEMRNYYLFQNF